MTAIAEVLTGIIQANLTVNVDTIMTDTVIKILRG